jgi:hypothetical protein
VSSASRTVDLALPSEYARGAECKLHNFTEKYEDGIFNLSFLFSLSKECIPAAIISLGVELGLGGSWAVSHGEVWRVFGYNMAIMVLYYGGPREGHWLQETNANYEDAIFAAQYIGQYWAGLSSIRKIDPVIHPPTYGDNTDPFDPIRHFTDKCSAAIHSALAPGRILIVDESMAVWKGKRGKYGGNGFMHGWMVVARKPTNCGRESHTTVDCDMRCIIFLEPYEGKERM